MSSFRNFSFPYVHLKWYLQYFSSRLLLAACNDVYAVGWLSIFEFHRYTIMLGVCNCPEFHFQCIHSSCILYKFEEHISRLDLLKLFFTCFFLVRVFFFYFEGCILTYYLYLFSLIPFSRILTLFIARVSWPYDFTNILSFNLAALHIRLLLNNCLSYF